MPVKFYTASLDPSGVAVMNILKLAFESFPHASLVIRFLVQIKQGYGLVAPNGYVFLSVLSFLMSHRLKELDRDKWLACAQLTSAEPEFFLPYLYCMNRRPLETVWSAYATGCAQEYGYDTAEIGVRLSLLIPSPFLLHYQMLVPDS